MAIQNKGWIVTMSATGINLMCGMLYSWSVFAAALVKNMGFSNTQASIPFTIAMAMLALLSIFGGKLQDLFSPRICGIICGVLCGSGMIISAFANSITMLALSFGLIAGAGCGLAYGATTPASVKWFPPQKRGLISGIVVAGVGLAPVYVAPMTQYLINNFGVRNTFLFEGIFYAIVILTLAQFLANPPEGYVPPGMQVEKKAVEKSTQSKRNYSPVEMIKSYQFWLIWIIYACGAMAGLMIIGHMVNIAQVQANVSYAFIFVALLAIFNAGGRVVGGFFSDKLGRNKTLIFMFGLQAINMLLFKNYTTSGTLILGIALAGICYGSLLAVFPALIFDYYGMKNAGINYGIVFTSWGVAGVVGPVMAGYIVDLTETYNTAYLLAAGLLLLSIVLVIMLRAPKQSEVREAIPAASKN
ncbi:arabinose efflux permease [Pelotomaculum thermopropionicum SI]|uniref:Arabinose efflux permease n=1 Tax=Pelotomaculum thermopropionicum (strain DSM 13744 / JCM 10971 / SI) TaxID=370438 RepID=A5CZG9_PELTS|nr:arabinose efflux permease [Pelotomaculum thermopropionicum SI]